MALSYSQLQMYRRCPKQYEYAVIKKVPRRISAGESFGSSIHNTLKRFGELEMHNKQIPVTKKQLALFTDHEEKKPVSPSLDLTTLLTIFRECFIGEGYESRAARDSALLRGETILRDYFTWWKREPREIVSIESGFKFTLEDPKRDETETLVLSGRFDRVERIREGLRIIDYKTSQPTSKQEVDADLQLSIYALAAAEQWHEPIAELVLLFLTEDGLVERITNRNPSQLHDALTSIRLLQGSIEQSDFRASPSAEKCRNCPYRERCPSRI